MPVAVSIPESHHGGETGECGAENMRPALVPWRGNQESGKTMKMRPGTPTGFLLCGKEWTEGETLEVKSPWDQGLVGRATIATRADARQAVNHAAACLRRTRAMPRWKRREILED